MITHMVEGLPILWVWEWELQTQLLALGGLLVYFIPAIVAILLRRKDWPGMFLFNFLLGWTVMGWFLVLNWVIGNSSS